VQINVVVVVVVVVVTENLVRIHEVSGDICAPGIKAVETFLKEKSALMLKWCTCEFAYAKSQNLKLRKAEWRKER